MNRTNLTSNADGTNNTFYQSTPFTPTANRLVLAFVASVTATATPANTPTITSTGLTWEPVHTAATAGAGDSRITCFRAVAAASTTVTVVINFAGQQQDSCAWSIFEYDGVATTGTSGSDAVVQKADEQGVGQALSAPLDSAVAGASQNHTVGALLLSPDRPVTAGANFTQIDNKTSSGVGRNIVLQTQESSTPVQKSEWTWSGGSVAVGIVLEIKAAAAATGGTPADDGTFEDRLARRFAPILFLHRQERLVPVNAQRYVEQAAMWKTTKPPIDEKNNWVNVFRPGEISTEPNDVRCLDTSGSGQDKFLEVGGWKDKSDNAEPDVTATSTNLYANRAQIEKIYNDTDRDITPWYHAEVIDIAGMKTIASQAGTQAPDYGPTIDRIDRNVPNARLLNYYLFFPDHVQSVGGVSPTDSSPCDNVEAKEVSCHAADWQCISLLLRGDTDGDANTYSPVFIGLTGLRPTRFEAPDGSFVYAPHEFDDDKQTVMKLAEWQPTSGPSSGLPATIDSHPKLFVALGSHSLYVSPVDAQDLDAYQANDDRPDYCGKRDTLRPVAPPPSGNPDDPYGSDEGWFEDLLIAMGKFLAGLGNGGAPGAVIAGYAIAEEGGVGNAFGYPIPLDIIGDDTTPDATPPRPVDAITIRPEAVPVPDEGARQFWKSKQQAEQDGRKYDYLVNRDKQQWWPHPDNEHGYYGRWGQQVAADPFGRRSGPHFPNYVRMFLAALESGLRGPSSTPEFTMGQ